MAEKKTQTVSRNQAKASSILSRLPPELWADAEERAAIIEEGCRISREEAERRTFDLLKPPAISPA